MSRPDRYSYRRYLEAKRTVDDRALHRPTLDRLSATLDRLAAGEPFRVLEVGAGTGTMLRRLVEWDVLPSRVAYTGVDLRGPIVEAARKALSTWADERGFEATAERPFHLDREDRSVTAEFEVADAMTFAAREAGEREWDLLVGASFLDQVTLEDALDALFPLLASDGLWWFPLTFDGATAFEPTPDRDVERRVLDAYHDSMDTPNRPGGSRTGRALFAAVDAAGGTVSAAGGSDRVVHPVDGEYPDDETYFLHHVLHTVETTVADGDGDVDGDRLKGWSDRRHAAVERGELTYISHQVDAFGRASR